MKTNKLQFLNCLFITSIITANLTASKVVDTGIDLFSMRLYIPSVAINYAFAFLCTDIIGELYGKREAQKCVRYGLWCQCVMVLCVIVSIALPTADSQFQEAYKQVLGQSFYFVLGSMVGYIISQSCDVWIFHAIKKYLHYNVRLKWVWNNASTLTSQLIDTFIFITISFGLGKGWLFQSEQRVMLLGMIVGQYILKAFFAILDTPFFYLLTKKSKLCTTY